MPFGLPSSLAVSAHVGGGVFVRADWSTMHGVRLGMTATMTIKNPKAGAALMR